VLAGALEGDASAIPFSPFYRNFDLERTREILPCNALGIGNNLLHAALSYYIASVLARSGSKIHNIVRCSKHLFIMFYNYEGISKVSKICECIDEALIVSLMKTNRWLIQNIEHAHERTAYLCGKPDSLGFTT